MRISYLMSGIAISLLISCTYSNAADENGFFEKLDQPNNTRWSISSGWVNGDHQGCEWRAEEISYKNDHLQLGLSDHGGKVRPIGCSEIHTTGRLGYGTYEARLKTAAGSGLNTGFFTFIGPPNGVAQHDEIDFEFLGKNPHSVQLNYFVNAVGKHEYMASLDFDASEDFHNYAFEWTPQKITWYVDNKKVHETQTNENMPHNPGMLFLTLWSGSAIEDAWMGPFKYTNPVAAEVEWAAYTPADKPCQFPESLKCKLKQ